MTNNPTAITAEDIFHENGFTDDMILPNHLVMMLMNKYVALHQKASGEFAKGFAEWIDTEGFHSYRDDNTGEKIWEFEKHDGIYKTSELLDLYKESLKTK